MALLNQVVAHSSQTPVVSINSQNDNGTYRTQSVSFTTEAGLVLDAQLLVPDAGGTKPALVYVETTALGSTGAQQLAASGTVVLDLMPRGLPSGVDPTVPLGDWVSNVRALLIGRTLPGMRAYDILQGVEILAARGDVDPARISVLASGVAGFWALVAAATDSRIASVQIDLTPYSFQPALDGPVHHGLHDAIIGGFFLQFDIADVRLELCHAAGRERLAKQAPVALMCRRISGLDCRYWPKSL